MWRLGAAWARPAALRGARGRRGLAAGAAAGSSAGGLVLRSRPGPGGAGGCKCGAAGARGWAALGGEVTAGPGGSAERRSV